MQIAKSWIGISPTIFAVIFSVSLTLVATIIIYLHFQSRNQTLVAANALMEQIAQHTNLRIGQLIALVESAVRYSSWPSLSCGPTVEGPIEVWQVAIGPMEGHQKL